MRRVFTLKRRFGHELGLAAAGARLWVIEDQAGRRIGRPQHDYQQAQADLEFEQTREDRRAGHGPRPCLVCGTTFLSEGRHNRLCGTCRFDRLDWPMAGV